MNSYQTTLEKLEQSFTTVSCSSPKFFIIKGMSPDECRYRHHHFLYTEKIHGSVMTITRVCKHCGLGIGEVFLSRKNNLSCFVEYSKTLGTM